MQQPAVSSNQNDSVIPNQHDSSDATTADVSHAVRSEGVLVPILFGVAGALMAWGIVQSFSPVFRVPEEYYVSDIGAPIEDLLALSAAKERVNRNNAMFELACLAVLIAGMLALRVAWVHRDFRPLLKALLVAAIAGCVAGFLGIYCFKAFGIRLPVTLTDMVILQTIMFGVLGLGVGLGVALGPPNCSANRIVAWGLSGMLGGILAGVVCPIASAVILVAAASDALLPTSGLERLICYGIFATAVTASLSKSAAR